MPTVGDVAPLLYRARWLARSLSGEVSSRREWPGTDGNDELGGTVSAGPGGRYRADLVDEDGDREVYACDGWSGAIPFPMLLTPSWLLADFNLEAIATTEQLGRAAYRVTASRRQPAAGAGGRAAERVEALVDAELGILLRYEKTGPCGELESAEFTRLSVTSAKSADLAGPDVAASPELSDEQVNLLYRSDLGPRAFSADVHEWADLATITRLGEEALAATSLGSHTRWLWQSDGDSPPDINIAVRVQIAMPSCYRIEAVTDPGPKPTCTV